ncbi:MAG: phage Gp37/Gp68 family protein [Blastocatellia bacterium]
MGETTAIKWTDHTFNIVWGCVQVSPACANCYAMMLARRWGFDLWGADKPRRTFGEKHWREPLKWNARAEAAGMRRRVFCSSMADVFEDHPTVEQEREKLWPLIRQTPWLDWQLLTKRADRILDCLPNDWGEGYENVWLGVTAENQEWADRRLPYLMHLPAKVRFVSCESLLGPIDLDRYLHDTSTFNDIDLDMLDWVIVGGESGPKHRTMNLEWAKDLREQCRDRAGFFFKQVGGLRPDSGGDLLDGERIQEMPRALSLW